ncbi:ABC transporter permease [Fontibacillus sp. BL9]|uniref:ABC transporter permease n=1 Tax=Fontibacillus sp. BL9 TaxID=3389971 RepID=UPI00397A4C31
MSILKLTFAHLRKGKGAAFSLFALLFIAASLLNSGFTILTAMYSLYNDKAVELHDARVAFAMSARTFKPEYEAYVKSYPGVEAAEAEKIILLPKASVQYDRNIRNENSIRLALMNADTGRNIAPLMPLEQSAAYGEKGIYVPYFLKASGGYRLGDEFSFKVGDKSYSYRIAGFFETTLTGTRALALLKFYLPEASYRQLSEDLGESYQGVFLSAVFREGQPAGSLMRDYSLEFPESNESIDTSFWSGDLEEAQSSTLTVNLVAMIFVAFAAIIVTVSLIMIQFQISNGIEDGMVRIGILKAIGYTSRQIRLSYTLQFLMIAVPGIVAGIAASYAGVASFEGIAASLTGLLKTMRPDIAINAMSGFALVVLVLAVSLLASRRIPNLQPIDALRGGFVNHNFKRNRLPLDKAKGGLQLILALKATLANSRQSLMIVAIVAVTTFASVFSIVLYSNIAGDKKAFFELVGAETPNVGIIVAMGQDSDALLDDVKTMNGVKAAIIQDFLKTTIDGRLIETEYSDDFSQLNTKTVYKGRYPKHDNEIVVTGGLARLLGKSVGDTIKVRLGYAEHFYLITGLKQSLNAGSRGASLTMDGVHRLLPGKRGMSINVYLNGISDSDFIRDAQAKFGSRIQALTDVPKSIEETSKVYVSAVRAVMVAILAITVLVVGFIQYLVIETAIVRRKKEFGILKAIGYTSFQLQMQIALGLVPVVAAGLITGGALGGLYMNSLLALLLSGSGISHTEFAVRPMLLLGLCVFLLLASYAISLSVSRRVNRISVYGLMTE